MLLEPARMLKLRLVASRRHERALLERLGARGVVQLTHAADACSLAANDLSTERAYWSGLAARARELQRSLSTSVSPSEEASLTTPARSPEEMLRAIEERAAELAELERQNRERRERVSRALADANLYREAAEVVARARGNELVHVVLGSVESARWPELSERVDGRALLLPLACGDGRQALLAMTTARNRRAIGAELDAGGFSAAPREIERDLDSWRAELEHELTALSASEAARGASLRALAEDSARVLAAIRARAEHELCVLVAREELVGTERAFVLTGWIPAARAASVEADVAELVGGRSWLDLTDAGGASEPDVPVLLTHSRLLSAFAALAGGYGLPRYRELAPTPFLAVSYVVMFGMMFGDVGHGLVLLAAGVALLRRRDARLRDAAVILCCVGASSAVFGAVYGSYFGLEGARGLAIWHDPLAGSPLSLMLLAIGQGVLLISLGLALNIANHLRRGEIRGALTDKFGLAGVAFYWGVIGVVIANVACSSCAGLWPLALVIVATPLLVWLFEEPLRHWVRRRESSELGAHLFTAAATSALEAFEAVLAYLANTVSFVRLAAYAMSHAALLAAVSTLAAELARVRAVGPALAALVLVAGNVVAMILEGAVAGVQALRLEYYEFFSKFFSGDGRPFTPFRLERCGAPWARDWDGAPFEARTEVSS